MWKVNGENGKRGIRFHGALRCLESCRSYTGQLQLCICCVVCQSSGAVITLWPQRSMTSVVKPRRTRCKGHAALAGRSHGGHMVTWRIVTAHSSQQSYSLPCVSSLWPPAAATACAQFYAQLHVSLVHTKYIRQCTVYLAHRLTAKLRFTIKEVTRKVQFVRQ